MRVHAAFILLSALLISFARPVAAQAHPAFTVRGALSAELRLGRLKGMALVAAPTAATQGGEVATRPPPSLAELRRGRALIAAGTTLALSGAAIQAGLGSRRICSDRVMVAPFASGGLVAGAGLVMMMRGGFTLSPIPTAYRRGHRPTRGKRTGMAIGVLALAALSQAVMWAVSVPEIIDCSTT